MQANLSVVIPFYNNDKTIIRAINSIFDQTLKPKEVIFVDDGSTDSTLETVLRALDFKSYPIKFIIISLKKNSGPGSARNRGWELANQPYIAFLDADDSWHSRKIELQYTWMISHQNVALSGHPASLYYPNADVTPLYGPLLATQIKPFSALLKNPFSTPTVMMKRDIALHFEEGKRHVEDFQLWLEVILSGFIVYKLNLPLTYLHKARFGESGLSSQLWIMEKGELQTYSKLNDLRLIGKTSFIFFSVLSMLKYFKRVFSSRLINYLLTVLGKKRFLW